MKATHASKRETLTDLVQIPNVGPATAGDLVRIGYSTPESLVNADAIELYQAICNKDGIRHDPCVLDVFMAAVDFMNGNPPKPWWKFTDLRKTICQQRPEIIPSH